jgi:GTP 3',8-cyclase
MLKDAHNRKIDYLRLSLTDRCNLRCAYCMPQDMQAPLSKGTALHYEQMLLLVRVLAELGIKKIRLTGGEPLLYGNILKLIEDIQKIPQIQNISITTNGVLLHRFLKQLKVLDIDSINISLDSVDAKKYQMITGFDYADKVFENICHALEMGFKMIKINSVISPYVDSSDISSLVKKLSGLPVVLRFIEMMPTHALKDRQCQGSFGKIPLQGAAGKNMVIDVIDALNGYAPTDKPYGFGPAKYYASKKDPLVIGIIHNDDASCFFCNRLRLTSQGKLILCIFSGKTLDLKKELRQNQDIGHIKDMIQDFVRQKPKNRTLASHEGFENCLNECMYKIGG